MLSKSAGKNVSFFSPMILVGAVELMQHLVTQEFRSEEEGEETCFSSCSVAQVSALAIEITDDLMGRLSATQTSTSLGNSCFILGKELFKFVDLVSLSLLNENKIKHAVNNKIDSTPMPLPTKKINI